MPARFSVPRPIDADELYVIVHQLPQLLRWEFGEMLIESARLEAPMPGAEQIRRLRDAVHRAASFTGANRDCHRPWDEVIRGVFGLPEPEPEPEYWDDETAEIFG